VAPWHRKDQNGIGRIYASSSHAKTGFRIIL
jgi:hypothetical protein